METDQAKHEKEESLILAQFGPPHSISPRLQNGCRFSEGSPQPTGDNNWITSPAQYNPNKVSNSVKRHRENCILPASEDGQFDQLCYKMNGDLMNSELNHGFTGETLLHQPKRMKVDVEIKRNDGTSSDMVDNLPELTNATNLECSSSQREFSLDKRNHSIQNGDIFCRPRNKQITNGAVSASSTLESTPGDLLEKTLSQYYPEQVSIAPQTSGSQLDTVNGSLTNQLSSEGAQPPALGSGLLNSAQMPNSQQQQQPRAPENSEGANSCNRYLVNGFSSSFGADHQQQPHAYSGLEQGTLSGKITPTNDANCSQEHPNSVSHFADQSNPQSTYKNTQQEFDNSSFLRSSNAQHAIDEDGEYRCFSSSGVDGVARNQKSGQFLHLSTERSQCEIQSQSFQENGRTHNSDDEMGHMGPGLQQQHHIGKGTGMERTGWMEGNPSNSTQQQASVPPSQTQNQDMWRALPPNPHVERTASPHVDAQIMEPGPAQIFPTQRSFTDRSPGSNTSQQKHQDFLSNQIEFAPTQHNTATRWQHQSPKALQMQQTLANEMSDQQNFPQNQQANNCFQKDSQHLSEDTDLQEILSAGLMTQQQQHCKLQRPLSHPPQFEEQQLKSPHYRPHSQPPPEQHLPQPSQSLGNNLAQANNSQHCNHTTFMYSNKAEMQQQQKQYLPNLKQFQPQLPNNHCHKHNKVDFVQTSTQSQPHLPQGALNQQVRNQMHPKAEPQLKSSCTQFQRGPQLPLGSMGPQTDFQRNAAIRMHLLQKQERQNSLHPFQSSDFKQRAVKMEPQFELPTSQQQGQLLHMREAEKGGLQVKQENHPSPCNQKKIPGSILASMEQSLRQYQLSTVFEKKNLLIHSSNKVKVESSGPVTILSTNTEVRDVESSISAQSTKKSLDFTPKKEQLLQSFVDSPMKLLDTPIKNLLDTPMKTQYDIASCHCVDQIIEKDEGPYYTHLGSAPTVTGIREMMEKRSGLTGHAIRIEKVIYTGKEGKSTQGCPIAKWVIRRSSVEEKLLVLVRERTGHRCETACIIVVILVWEGIQASLADRLYLELSETLKKNGAHTQRRCAFNEERTCACQGLNPEESGASFSFGCSWSMYYNGCKFARSKIPRKFKLLGDDVKEEEKVERNFQNLATLLGPLYKTMAPEAYGNQVEHEHRAPDCRLGLNEGRPFSGVTACMDFCAHAHRDLHNMQGGSTVVCTLTREDNREIGRIPEDEQLHVLPLYKASNTDEFGSEEGQQEKVKSGAIQVLSTFRRQIRMLAEPAKSCRQKKLEAKKAAANKNATLESSGDKAEKASQAKSKAGTYENTAQSTPMTGPPPGAVGATMQSGHLSHPLGVHPQQQQSMIPPYSRSTHPGFMRFPNPPGSFPSTSKPGSMCPTQAPTPASPYPSPLNVSNSYMNGPNRPYPGYQRNGGMPLDNCHPYYLANQKHLNMYQQQLPALYPEQQYGLHQRFDVNYPPRYSESGLQVNGYNGMRPAQIMQPYSPYGPSRPLDAQFIDPLPRLPSAHGGMDYSPVVSKSNQLGEYPNTYLHQNPRILPTGLDPFHPQVKTEMGIPDPQMISAQLRGGCLNPDSQSGLSLPNGGVMGSNIKQEPGTPKTPTTPQKPEVWSDNEHNFLDPEIGGVAVAPSHGSVLIECAKRELHATTPLKNPDRNHPTRISLVFYQHKNLNEAKHGLALWEAKMAEKAREKEEEAERNGGEGTPSKGNKKGVKREHPESETTGEPPYKRFIKALMEGSLSSTSNTYVNTSPYAFTKVTGPYSRFA
ncbi:Methylcytosine dioxygenase TET2 [Oryzias melastigma]|uniref:Methylcytosine dioxygenase TET n=1 Tax=Oryzias melastigma TaxID=30732 RepID=A0A834FR18_ORYME|nr:Methylcytosine dioxygenase TET2 [Oryzias melastigma]